MFGQRVREKINEVIERMVKQKFGQNIYNKEKIGIEKPYPSKNKYIVVKDADKNMGTEEDANKTDVISECERQMRDIKTYLKISEEE